VGPSSAEVVVQTRVSRPNLGVCSAFVESWKFTVPGPVDIGLTLGPLVRGGYDPTTSFTGGEFWRATRTPDGPATLCLRADGDRVRARAWGPGASAVLEAAPDLVGCGDDPSVFEPQHAVLRDVWRRFRGLRLGRTGAVIEALVPSILEQKVTGKEAFRSYEALVRRYGEAAPGPVELIVPPPPSTLAELPYWAYHPLGIERRRADTVRRACARAARMEEAAAMPLADAYRRLRAIQGVGQWTAAEVARVALGDPDAVSVGDYHLKNHVAWVLAGEPRATDERMLELLEPYLGQRARAIRLIEACPTPPRFGPRVRLRDIARM
jgi:3-methyladenine DNA glycosylase/8-oxoguanine DNA glycosylase